VSVRFLLGDVFEQMATLPDNSIDCCVTSPPYWGLRDYGVAGQIGLEPTLGEHLAVMVRVFDEVRRVLTPSGTCWINYGDCYATKPNGRSTADTKATGNDDRTFRDKPFSTVGPIYDPEWRSVETMKARAGRKSNGEAHRDGDGVPHTGKIVSGGLLKPKDLCMIPNRLAIALQDAGWWVRSEIVWGKPNAMPDSSGKYRPSTAHEKVWLLTKSGKSYYDHAAVALPVSGNAHSRVGKGYKMPDSWDTGPGGHGSFHREGRQKGRPAGVTPKSASEGSNVRAKGSFHASTTAMVETRYLRNYEPAPLEVWEISSQAFREAHFATFPPELPRRCILAGCPVGGTVLDPFAGAGTTGLVADRLQRNAILIELNPEYAAMAERRIGDDAPLLAAVA